MQEEFADRIAEEPMQEQVKVPMIEDKIAEEQVQEQEQVQVPMIEEFADRIAEEPMQKQMQEEFADRIAEEPMHEQVQSNEEQVHTLSSASRTQQEEKKNEKEKETEAHGGHEAETMPEEKSIADWLARYENTQLVDFVGTFVRIRGLKAKPWINEEVGIVTDALGTGRLAVRLEKFGEEVSIHPRNTVETINPRLRICSICRIGDHTLIDEVCPYCGALPEHRMRNEL